MLMEMQDMPQRQDLSVEPILANEHIRVASPQAGGDFGGTSVRSFLRVVSEVIAACDNSCRLTLTSPAVGYNWYAEHVLHSPHQMFESSHVNSQQMHILRLL